MWLKKLRHHHTSLHYTALHHTDYKKIRASVAKKTSTFRTKSQDFWRREARHF